MGLFRRPPIFDRLDVATSYMSEEPSAPIPQRTETGVHWQVTPFDSFEDLAELMPASASRAIKLSTDPVRGIVASLKEDGSTAIACAVEGKVALQGAMPSGYLTIQLSLRCGAGSLQWLRPVGDGSLLFLPSSGEQDAVMVGPTALIACSVPEAYLHLAAENAGVHLSDHAFAHPRLFDTALDGAGIAGLDRIHRLVLHDGGRGGPAIAVVRDTLVDALVRLMGREPAATPGKPRNERYRLIVHRAREWIEGHLDQEITVDLIAAAAATSRRTLHRAFISMLGESARSYVLRLRLHRIRQELKVAAEAETTVAVVANQWGISELGRLSARYRTLFGELPSQTLAWSSLSTPNLS